MIKRYNVAGGETYQLSNGYLVYYEDHLSAIGELRDVIDGLVLELRDARRSLLDIGDERYVAVHVERIETALKRVGWVQS